MKSALSSETNPSYTQKLQSSTIDGSPTKVCVFHITTGRGLSRMLGFRSVQQMQESGDWTAMESMHTYLMQLTSQVSLGGSRGSDLG